MNSTKYCFSVLVCLMLGSCKTDYTKNEIILKAESLLYTAPDSSYNLLSSIKNPEKLPAADYAAWCLNYTHAQYKLYMDIKSDSVINIAVQYYSKRDLAKYTGTAYYLSGCIAKMHHDNKKAMLAYKKADDVLKLTNENDLKGLVNFYIGVIYGKDDLFNLSLNYYYKSLSCFKQSKNIKYQAYAYRAIADTYNEMNYPLNKSIYYTDLAIRFSKQANDSVNYYNNISRKGELLSKQDYAASTDLLLQGYKYLPSHKQELAAFLAFTHSQLNKFDLARHYLNIALSDTSNANSKLIPYLAAAYVFKGEGDLSQAFLYLEKAYTINDSTSQKSILNQLYRIDKQYDLVRKEKENSKLRIANQQKVIAITLLTTVVLIVLIIMLLIRSNHKQKQVALEMINQQLRSENVQKRELLLVKLQNRIENTLQFNQLKLGFLEKDKHDEFIKEITKQAVISEKERQYYIDEVNRLFDGKVIGLTTTIPGLTPSDLIVISLICMKIDIADSCSLLGMNSNTMYVRRKRIKIRIGIDKDIDLDEWVMQHVAVYE